MCRYLLEKRHDSQSPSPTRRSRWLAGWLAGWQSDQSKARQARAHGRSSSEALPLSYIHCLSIIPYAACHSNHTHAKIIPLAQPSSRFAPALQYHTSTQPISASRRHDVTSLCAATIGRATLAVPDLSSTAIAFPAHCELFHSRRSMYLSSLYSPAVYTSRQTRPSHP